MSTRIFYLYILLLSFFTCIHTYSKSDNVQSQIYQPESLPLIISGQALYWRTSNTSFGGEVFNPSYSFGYQLSGKYKINDTKKFLSQWIQYKKLEPFDQFTNRNPFGNNDIRVIGNFLEELEILNLSISKSIDFKDKLEIEFYGGLQFFGLKNKEKINLIDPVSNSTLNENLEMIYRGFGPRIGISMAYDLLDNLKIYADVAIASIVVKGGSGNISLETIDRRYTPAINLSYVDKTKKRGPVGSQEGNLGLTYVLNKSNGRFNIVGGVSGISFDLDDTRFSGYFLGATWVGDE